MPDWLITLLILGGMVLLLTYMGVRAQRHYRAQQAALKVLREQEQPLKLFDQGYGLRAEIITLNGEKPLMLQHPLLSLNANEISLHENELPIREVARFPLSQLR